MTQALDFIDPDKLSMVVVLTAMNRFLNETDGLQVRDPIATGRREYTRRGTQSRRGGESIPSAGPNRDGEERIYPARETIWGVECILAVVGTGGPIKSSIIPGAGTDRDGEERVYPAQIGLSRGENQIFRW